MAANTSVSLQQVCDCSKAKARELRSLGMARYLVAKRLHGSNKDRRLDCMQAGEPRKHKSRKDNCASRGSATKKHKTSKQSEAPSGASVRRSVQGHAGSATLALASLLLTTLTTNYRLTCSKAKAQELRSLGMARRLVAKRHQDCQARAFLPRCRPGSSRGFTVFK